MFAFVDVLAKVVSVAPDVDDGTIGVAVDNPSAFRIGSSSNEVSHRSTAHIDGTHLSKLEKI